MAVDDPPWLTSTAVYTDGRAGSTVAYARATVRCYQSLGIKVRQVITDNGSCCCSNALRMACKEFSAKHIRTKPYSPGGPSASTPDER